MKTSPLPHQLEEFEHHADDAARGEFWEPRCGKTWPILATAEHLWRTGRIDCAVVLAPNGVHETWSDQVDEHAEGISVAVWPDEPALGGLPMLCISFSRIMRPSGLAALKRYMKDRRCLLIIDETQYVKTPGAKVTIRTLALSKHATYTRILTGTLVADGPFDVDPQIRLLDHAAWHGVGAYGADGFRNRFGEYKKGWGARGEFKELVRYRDLDMIRKVVLSYGDRRLKADVLNLPHISHEVVHYDLDPEQRRVYDELFEEFKVELEHGTLSASLTIAQRIRLQQVTSGYAPTDDDRALRPVGHPVRVDFLRSLIDGPTIVWAKYREDIRLICADLKAHGVTHVRYDGSRTHKRRSEARKSARKGEVEVFVGNPALGGPGLDLSNFRTMIYYNNGDKLVHRNQSEDRFLSPMMDRAPRRIIDVCARNTLDEDIRDNLIEKARRAAEVMGDPWTDPKNRI